MVFTEVTMATATGTAGLYGLMLKIVCGGSRQICERVTSQRRKRRKKIQMLMMALCGAITATSTQRSIWMRRRSQEWWDQDVAGYTEQEFFQNFRMSRNAFHHICQRLSLSRGDTSFRRSIYLRKRLGVGVYWVARGAGYHTLANLFGIAKSSAKLCTRSSCMEVLQEVLQGFRQRWGKNDVKVALNATWLFRLRSH